MPIKNIEAVTGTSDMETYAGVAAAIRYNKSDGQVYLKDQNGTVRAIGGGTAESGQHLSLNTTSDDKQVRINSRNYTQTSGGSIEFQSKPAQTVASSGNVIGGEVSPRVNDGIALTGSGSLIGLHIDTYVRGTTASTIAGDVRALQLELVGDDGGQKTITGDISAIRIRSYLPLAANTGLKQAIKIEKPETGGHPYDAVLALTSTLAGIWNDAPGTEPTTADGYIKVLVNGNARYIQLYSGAPVD